MSTKLWSTALIQKRVVGRKKLFPFFAWGEVSKLRWVKQKRSFYFFWTFICYRECLNLNCYISKKVQKIFLMGLKIWWSWGSRFFFSKSPIVGRFSIFHAKLQFLRGWVLFLVPFLWFFCLFVPKSLNQLSRRSVAKWIKPAS